MRSSFPSLRFSPTLNSLSLPFLAVFFLVGCCVLIVRSSSPHAAVMNLFFSRRAVLSYGPASIHLFVMIKDPRTCFSVRPPPFVPAPFRSFCVCRFLPLLGDVPQVFSWLLWGRSRFSCSPLNRQGRLLSIRPRPIKAVTVPETLLRLGLLGDGMDTSRPYDVLCLWSGLAPPVSLVVPTFPFHHRARACCPPLFSSVSRLKFFFSPPRPSASPYTYWSPPLYVSQLCVSDRGIPVFLFCSLDPP